MGTRLPRCAVLVIVVSGLLASPGCVVYSYRTFDTTTPWVPGPADGFETKISLECKSHFYRPDTVSHFRLRLEVRAEGRYTPLIAADSVWVLSEEGEILAAESFAYRNELVPHRSLWEWASLPVQLTEGIDSVRCRVRYVLFRSTSRPRERGESLDVDYLLTFRERKRIEPLLD